ncbi:YNFM family putative membrane transporter [Arthrobacter woluwensis]|uniref:MFS transporter n=1 Tax=Arthrobacter woluwensis TaxID=156980 RepID=UPI00277FDF62|nr:MFS transporter [Arthrobacter woluwensis]MDQ0708406.1 YNFM family putative membrane transporter [Arthrobacter woluwensis]
MAALLAAGVATFAQLYAIQGVLPGIARELSLSASTAALSVSAATTGLAVGVLLWAAVADRIGRLRCMRIAVAGTVVLGLATAVAPGLELLLGLRFLTGLVVGGVPVLAVAYVYEQLAGSRAAVAATVYISGTTVGGALGRLVAGPLGAWAGWRSALLGVGLMSLAAAVIFLWLAPRERGPHGRATGSSARGARSPGTPGRIRQALKPARLNVLYVQAFLVTGSFVAVFNFLTFRLEAAPFFLPAALVSLVFLAYFAGTASSRLAGRWLSRRGFAWTSLCGVLAMIAGLAILLVDRLPAIIVGLLLFTAGNFMSHAAAVATVGARAGEAFRGQASALYNIAFYLGSSVLGWLLGLAFDGAGWLGMSCGIAGALLLVVVLNVVGLRRAAGRA